MTIQNKREFAGGLFLAALGLFVAIYAYDNLALGTATRIGPGLFPLGVGVLMAIFGLGVLVSSFASQEVYEEVDIRTAVILIGAVFAFALIVPFFGLIPAIVAVVALSSSADGQLGLIRSIVAGVILALFVSLVFRVGLGFPFALLNWPW